MSWVVLILQLRVSSRREDGGKCVTEICSSIDFLPEPRNERLKPNNNPVLAVAAAFQRSGTGGAGLQKMGQVTLDGGATS